MLRRLFLILSLVLVWIAPVESACTGSSPTWTAASGSQADFDSCHTNASSGDTILMPSGTFSWTGNSTVTKNIHIQGAGGGRVEGMSTTSLAIGTGSKSFTVRSGSVVSSGFTVSETVRARVKYNAADWMEGTVTSWNGTTLVLNVTSTGGSGTFAAWVFEMPAATIITNNAGDTVMLTLTENTTASLELRDLRIQGGTGTNTGAMISMVTVTNGKPVIIHDVRLSSNNARVMKFNSGNRGLLYRVYMDVGFDWDNASSNTVPGYGIAVKHNNGFPGGNSIWDQPSTMGDLDTDGTHNIYIENTYITGFGLEAMDPDDNARLVFRYSVMDNSGSASHGADTSNIGSRHIEYYNNLWAFNDVGTATMNNDYFFFLRGGEGVFTDNTVDDISSSEWGNKSEIKLIVENLRRSAGPYGCYTGGWPAPHQVGQGWVNGAGFTDPPANGQTPQGFYVWNNTGTVAIGLNDYSPDGCGGGPAVGTYIQSGRDYFTTAKSGYTKYTYPHPLRSGEPPPSPDSPGRINPLMRWHANADPLIVPASDHSE